MNNSLEIRREKRKKVMLNVITTLPFVHIDTVMQFSF